MSVRPLVACVAVLLVAGCGGTASRPVGSGSATTETNASTGSETGPFLRFTAPEGTTWTDELTGASSMTMTLGTIEAIAGNLTPADIAELRRGFGSEFTKKTSFAARTSGTATWRVIAVAPNGTRDVEARIDTTSRVDGGGIQRLAFVEQISYLHDGSVRIGDVKVNGLGVAPAIRDTLVASVRSAAEQDATSRAFRLPLRAGASRDDPILVPVNIPLPGLEAQPIRIKGTIRTTYRGRVGANHVFATSGRLRTQPFVIAKPADGLDQVEFAIDSHDIAGKIVMTPDGRALSADTNSNIRFLLTFTTSLRDGQQSRFALRMPLVQSVRTRRQDP